MAATKEAKVKKRMKDILNELEIYHFFPPANGYGRAGIPDIVGCVNGKFIAIECKAGKGTTTALQDRELERITAAGGYTFLVRETNVDGMKEALRCLKQTS